MPPAGSGPGPGHGRLLERGARAGLGRCALAAGDATRAVALLRQALEIFQRIGAAKAGDVSRELTTLTEAGPPA